ncbi:Lymphocyte Expansion Molecule, partial [Manis pentadactyla]
WQQQFNEDREKGAVCNMILSHCPHPCPDVWEGLGPAWMTALAQTRLSISGQLLLRLLIFVGRCSSQSS